MRALYTLICPRLIWTALICLEATVKPTTTIVKPGRLCKILKTYTVSSFWLICPIRVSTHNHYEWWRHALWTKGNKILNCALNEVILLFYLWISSEKVCKPLSSPLRWKSSTTLVLSREGNSRPPPVCRPFVSTQRIPQGIFGPICNVKMSVKT